jgi:hypothetical protein
MTMYRPQQKAPCREPAHSSADWAVLNCFTTTIPAGSCPVAWAHSHANSSTTS